MAPPRLFLSLVLLFLIASMLYAAASGITSVGNAIRQAYRDLSGILPPLSMLLVIMGALTYAAGKAVPNPEFSGRASGLVAAMIAAALVGLIIVMILPGILQIMYPCPASDSACWDMSNVIF